MVDTIKLNSSSFPQGSQPKLESQVHSFIREHLQTNQLPKPIYRRSNIADIESLKLLQKEWFPLSYPQSFYHKIMTQRAICYVVEMKLKLKLKEVTVIVGAIVFEITEDNDNIKDSLFNQVFAWEERCLYIMTIGVIDQIRNKGIAQQLLKIAIKFAEEREKIKIITLHVVSYNKRAINFYKKQNFQLLDKIKDHYFIFGKQYEGLKLGYYVNNGKKRQQWIPWLKRVFLKSTIQWPE